MSKFWKVATIVAIATIPLVLLGKKKAAQRASAPADEADTDLFEQELRAE
jgi:hypothetical protein